MTYEYKPGEEWNGLTHSPRVKVSQGVERRIEKSWKSHGIDKESRG